MLYRLRHLTAYAYRNSVGFARCTLRLAPAAGDGQVPLSHEVVVEPAPQTATERADFFGNRTVSLTVEVPHRDFRIDARPASGSSGRALPDPGTGPAWEEVRARVLTWPGLGADAALHFAAPSRRVPLLPEITDYARASFPPRRRRLCGGLRPDAPHPGGFRLRCAGDRGRHAARRVVFRAPRRVPGFLPHHDRGPARPRPAGGLCQRLPAHPAAPGQPRLEGADASHAWVSVWCGEGWIGLDPTNGIGVQDDHIVVARGRDYADVAPSPASSPDRGRRACGSRWTWCRRTRKRAGRAEALNSGRRRARPADATPAECRRWDGQGRRGEGKTGPVSGARPQPGSIFGDFGDGGGGGSGVTAAPAGAGPGRSHVRDAPEPS